MTKSGLRHRVLCIGDSLVMGAWDTAGGWADRLKQSMNQRYVTTSGDDRVQVYNLGIGSETTETLLKRLDNELGARASEAWPMTVIVGIGKNDGRIVDGESLVKTTDFKENIAKIVEKIRRYTPRIVFVEPLPVNGDEVEFKNTFYRTTEIARYAELIREETAVLGVDYIALRDDFIKSEPEMCYAVDGIHLNDRGHEFIYKKVKQAVDRVIEG